MLTGFNHLTLSVSDLQQSFDFYSNLLGFKPEAAWTTGAYLSVENLWLCLSLSKVPTSERPTTYTHYAFSIPAESFDEFKKRVLAHGAHVWQQNSSEGDSFYFLDPDGYQLEVHVGSLASRLAACKLKPYDGMKFFG